MSCIHPTRRLSVAVWCLRPRVEHAWPRIVRLTGLRHSVAQAIASFSPTDC
jgi:hypothetical protein